MEKRIIVLISAFLFLVASMSLAGTVQLPQTGQTKCYDAEGTEVTCAGTGQDEDMRAGVDTSLQTVTANSTNQSQCPTGYIVQLSYSSSYRPPGTVIIGWGDNYRWLIYDSVRGWESQGSIQICHGYKGDYYHILNTNCVLSTVNNLKVNISGKGSVMSEPAGISCLGVCSGSYAHDATVTLKVKPATGYRFKKWSGACRGTKRTCTVKMSKAQIVKAWFKKK